jgi:hypothetical protein
MPAYGRSSLNGFLTANGRQKYDTQIILRSVNKGSWRLHGGNCYKQIDIEVGFQYNEVYVAD